ncbi:MarR family winged helix-turn-helix transcriptional regulator [Pseudonocardia kunmingensis]|uniref:MarR family transcriptional regulator n=1 Tax=Pseudonocardia kunmingensis TaxID=630975 RepID=A0A543E0T1_9PSEU|nr:MarR family transcriptional regulator [Pseudonocardia kunmingensis]TQM15144.1 MarR family transcriptional regulator [Pseudonocardia kunmingensis]
MSAPQSWERDHPGLDTSSMAVVGPLKAAQAAHDLLVEPLFATAPVGPAELDVLLKLRLGPQPTIAVALARAIGRSGAAISKTLAKLDQRGYVTRTPNPADRRAALVELTEVGAQVVDSLFPRQLALEAAALSTLTAEQRAEITAALTTLSDALRAAAANPPTRPGPCAGQRSDRRHGAGSDEAEADRRQDDPSC